MLKQSFSAVCLVTIVMVESALALFPMQEPNVFTMNTYIRPGISIGNALEAPREGDWGVTVKENYFNAIREVWFNSIRFPICWSAHALTEKPYTIDPNFFNRMDKLIEQAMLREVVIIITMHHYNELYQDPAGHKERFLAIWKQIAEHYKDYPYTIVFEILNEPHDNLKTAEWNALLKEGLAVVRQFCPTRKVIIGPVNYNDIRMLNTLELPKDDNNIIVTAHYYLPYEFTHQGAHWAADSNAWLGTKWNGTESEKQMILNDFNAAAAWSKENNRPICIGEFGAVNKADMDSRIRWTKFIADTATERGFSYIYWDFCGPFFGIYDTQKNIWNKPFLEALVPPRK